MEISARIPPSYGSGRNSSRFITTPIGQPKVRISEALTAFSSSSCDLLISAWSENRSSMCPESFSFAMLPVAVPAPFANHASSSRR